MRFKSQIINKAVLEGIALYISDSGEEMQCRPQPYMTLCLDTLLVCIQFIFVEFYLTKCIKKLVCCEMKNIISHLHQIHFIGEKLLLKQVEIPTSILLSKVLAL